MANTTSASVAEGDFRVGRVISRSISILSRRFVTLFFIATCAHLPILLIVLWMGDDFLSPDTTSEQAGQIVAGTLLIVAFTLFSALGQAMIVHVTFQDMRRQAASLGASVKVSLRRLLPLLGIAILVVTLLLLATTLFTALARLVAPFLLLLVVVAVTACFVTMPACVVEGRGPFGSMRRSAQLTKGHRWRIFGLELLLVGLTFITRIFLSLFDWALGALAGPVLDAVTGLLWLAALVGCGAVIIAVAYHDLRVAKEGVDIEQIASVFD